MFVQIIQGQVSDPDAVRAAMDRWHQELQPGATGWLGSTAGVTSDGTFVATARFDSADAAQRNSDRAEQGQWWAQTSQLLTGDVTFHDSTEVDVDLQGDPDQAGFVQVIQGHTSDPARARELMSENPQAWAAFRPEILGTVSALHDGDAYTAVIYFASEDAAREGEDKPAPPELVEQMHTMGELEVGEPTFLDLKDPWLYSP